MYRWGSYFVPVPKLITGLHCMILANNKIRKLDLLQMHQNLNMGRGGIKLSCFSGHSLTKTRYGNILCKEF